MEALKFFFFVALVIRKDRRRRLAPRREFSGCFGQARQRRRELLLGSGSRGSLGPVIGRGLLPPCIFDLFVEGSVRIRCSW